jgi:hypothetical protein
MYSSYEDARARERELLQLAQKHKIEPSGPPRQRRFLLLPIRTSLLAILRNRSATSRASARLPDTPAIA